MFHRFIGSPEPGPGSRERTLPESKGLPDDAEPARRPRSTFDPQGREASGPPPLPHLLPPHPRPSHLRTSPTSPLGPARPSGQVEPERLVYSWMEAWKCSVLLRSGRHRIT